MVEAQNKIVSMAAFRERRQLTLPIGPDEPVGRLPLIRGQVKGPANIEHRERMLRFLRMVARESEGQRLLR